MTRIRGLDAVRGIAFLVVFLVHTGYNNGGWVSIQIFFVLSGFLITGILVDMKRTLPRKEFFLKFYGRRFLRIFPLYYFYLVLAVLMLVIALHFGAMRNKVNLFVSLFLPAVLYVYNFFTLIAKETFPFTNHLWSLCVEEQFYLVWPLLIFLVPAKSHNKLFIASIVAGNLFRVAFSMANLAGDLPHFAEGFSRAMFVLPFTHLDAFAWGAYASQNKLASSSRQFAFLSILLPVLGFSYNTFVLGRFENVGGLGFPYLMENGNQYIWGYTVINYWAVTFIDAVAKENLFTRVLSLKVFIYLGKISYGLYIYHLGIVWITYRAFLKIIPQPGAAQIFGLAMLQLTLTVIIASLSYRYFELPLLNLKNKYFRIEGDPPYIPAVRVNL